MFRPHCTAIHRHTKLLLLWGERRSRTARKLAWQSHERPHCTSIHTVAAALGLLLFKELHSQNQMIEALENSRHQGAYVWPALGEASQEALNTARRTAPRTHDPHYS